MSSKKTTKSGKIKLILEQTKADPSKISPAGNTYFDNLSDKREEYLDKLLQVTKLLK